MNRKHSGSASSLPSASLTRRDLIQGLSAAWLAAGSTQLVAADENPRIPTPQLRKVREVENTWITMRDGTRLAARLWMPEDAESNPVPAILEYHPYYARLFARPGDDAMFPYYASRGYAGVRVDIRGSGNSQGRPLDEYVKQEQDDALEIIEWIARQPWCTGAVGMEGISWSGFSSLQTAARQPPALKAIIAHCASDDRYLDDAHYKGGCVIHDMFNWGTLLLAFQGQAPDPAIVGEERWRERWLERLNAVEFNLGKWMTHPYRDSFWKHGSVIEDYSQITCPVYAIDGWVDGYKNSVFRLLAGLKVPRKGLVGAWTHVLPNGATPGPGMDYLDEALRWWDHWLKGADTGIMEEPMLRVWMQHAVATPLQKDVPGRWIAETAWPSARIAERTWFLNGTGRLDGKASTQQQVALAPVQTVGLMGGNWCPSGGGASEDLAIEMALDQRTDDARSLIFDSEPLTEAVEILGSGSLALAVSCDKPVAYVIVRLNDVAPTGESGRVTYGILNLCHRESHEFPSALTPGARYEVRVPLDHAAHRFQPGHRIRIAISTTYWPMVLPAPEAVTLRLFTGSSRLMLPIRPPQQTDTQLPVFRPPYVPAIEVSRVSSEPGSRRIEVDVASGAHVIHHRVGTSVTRLDEIDALLTVDAKTRFEVRADDPSAKEEHEFTLGWQRGQFAPRLIATSKTTTTPTEFIVEGQLDAFDGEEKVCTRRWNERIPRKLV